MKTYYIRFISAYEDPVWGQQALPWSTSELIRVTRNNLHNAHFEWVGNPKAPFNIQEVKRDHPLSVYAELEH